MVYSSPNGTIQGINQTEIAERHGVTTACVSYWIKTWTDESPHPFPKPTCKIQQWIVRSDGIELWSRAFLCYDPWAVTVWKDGLADAISRKRSKSQKDSWVERRSTYGDSGRERPVGVPIVAQTVTPPALEELARRVTKLEETVIF